MTTGAHLVMKGFEPALLSLESRAELLGKSLLGGELVQSELITLAGYLEPYQLPAGCTIVEQGEQSAFMCLIAQGRVDIVKETFGGEHKVIATLGPRNTIGEMSLVDHEPRSALVMTHTPVQMLVLTAEALETMAEHHPRLWGKLMLKVARILSKRLRQTSGVLAEYLSE
jgi:CRP-like cAMP-binding protein